MIKYTWRVIVIQERTVIFDRLDPSRNGTCYLKREVRTWPRQYNSVQAAEQAQRDHFAGKSRYSRFTYPPEAKWELEEIQTCPNQFDPLLLTPLRSRMERLRQARSSQS